MTDHEQADVLLVGRRKVGTKVREWREAAGLSQRDLSEATGINHPNSISAIELGRNPIPSKHYMAFATALKVDPYDFGRFVLEWSDPEMFALLRQRLDAT